MKLHFIGALEGDKDSYRLIVGLSKSFGWDVVTEHSMVRKVDDVKNETPDEANEYARKMQRWIKAADVIVVEATTGVLGAGYEVATALNYGKPVVVLYQDHGSNAPHVLLGLTSDRLQVIDYNINNLKSILRASLEHAVQTMDTRFNFFVAPKHQHYLDWIAKHKRVPRAVYLRKLIEKTMEEDAEYLAE